MVYLYLYTYKVIRMKKEINNRIQLRKEIILAVYDNIMYNVIVV